ncbi:MAG: magnesium transporter [Oligoflexia bacterium]|nr:magnesium transporter [Oligoflexia bacterium]
MTNEELRTQIAELLSKRELRRLRDMLVEIRPADIVERISELSPDDMAVVFRILPRQVGADVFEYLDADQQKTLLSSLGHERAAVLLNEMDPDDRTALLEEFPPAAARQLVQLLSREERSIALRLLGYPEHSVGRLMTPDYVALREQWTVGQALEHVRAQARESAGNLHILYVLDQTGKLVDDIRIRDLLLSPLNAPLANLMNHSFVCLNATDDQEVAVHHFKKYDRTALPVIDSQGHMLGLVTVDDVLDVAEEEATEDIQKLGGVEALEDPYIKTPLLHLVKKRASWLVILFVGEMLTASAMGFFQSEIEQAVVLALFIPLIISSGGNSGSQAATLIIRSLAIGEVTLQDWFRVFKRELAAGLCLGLVLGFIGFLRIAVWSTVGNAYGPHWFLIGLSVSFSLVAVVLWGVLSGAMLPFLLKRLGLDPATSSAPFVATLVDVTGLVIYFTIAAKLLGGILL